MQTQSEQTTKAPFICLKGIEVDFLLQDLTKISEPNSLRLLSYCRYFKIFVVFVVCCCCVVVTLMALNFRFLPHSLAPSIKTVIEIFVFLGF